LQLARSILDWSREHTRSSGMSEAKGLKVEDEVRWGPLRPQLPVGSGRHCTERAVDLHPRKILCVKAQARQAEIFYAAPMAW
jgi:hypothetical protein